MKHGQEYRKTTRQEEASRKTRTTLEERKEWASVVNDNLRKMREEAAAGNEEASDRHGEEARRVFSMGPRKYAELKNSQSCQR